MIKLLESKRGIQLPSICLITDKDDLKTLSIGVPFIFGTEDIEEYLVRLLEFEVLYQNAIKTKFPFNFRQILIDNGFDDIQDFSWQNTVYMDYTTEGLLENLDLSNVSQLDRSSQNIFKSFVKDGSAYVDIQTIKDLKVFPVWLDTIENSVKTNIHNFAVFNSNMYNKKLEGMYGGLELTSPDRNLLSIDISASIPKAVGTSIMLLSKWMAETFYCDIIITGASTLFIPYEEIYAMNIDKIYNEYGNSQECLIYRSIITNDVKNYKTCIIFGDNHSVCDGWGGSKRISREDGQKLCKWKIDKLIAFHTTSNSTIPGFADWFKPNEVEHVKDWVKYLNK